MSYYQEFVKILPPKQNKFCIVGFTHPYWCIGAIKLPIGFSMVFQGSNIIIKFSLLLWNWSTNSVFAASFFNCPIEWRRLSCLFCYLTWILMVLDKLPKLFSNVPCYFFVLSFFSVILIFRTVSRYWYIFELFLLI